MTDLVPFDFISDPCIPVYVEDPYKYHSYHPEKEQLVRCYDNISNGVIIGIYFDWYDIVRETPKGVMIDYYDKEKYIGNDWRKQFASKTPEEAYLSLRKRREKQIKILTNQLNNAQASHDYLTKHKTLEVTRK